MTEKTYRILIAEDEQRIGALIQKLIHWDELGLAPEGLAENGEKALELILERQPDIVITDIRMPKINGLDLIEAVRGQYPSIRFIVLSGYREFEYAHRALQYNVDGYLLKPINEDELNDVLAQTIANLSAQAREGRERQEMRRAASESMRIIKRDLLRSILDSPDAFADRDASAAASPSVPLPGALFRVIDIKLDAVPFEQSDRREERILTEKIMSLAEEAAAKAADQVLTCEKEALNIYCLFNYSSGASKDIRACIGEILSQSKDYLMRFDNYEVTIGIGTERSSPGEIRASAEEACHAVLSRISLGTGRLIYFTSPGSRADAVSPVRAGSQLLTDAIASFQTEAFRAGVDRIFDAFEASPQADPADAYRIAEEITDLFFRNISGDSSQLAGSRRQIRLRCHHCTSLPDLRAVLTAALTDSLGAARDAALSESARPVRLAKAYVEDHYGEKIVLEDLAEIVGLNPVYFSVLFKKETDMNFSAYLTSVRMEKAKALLTETNETIAAIAEKVGYKDARYFSQTFTKAVGIKPALYRRLHA